jgi:hypothetical protein
MYRPSSKPPQTAWARHLDGVRRERDWSATQLFEYVQGPLGLSPKSRSGILPMLSDTEPNERQAAVLATLFGAPEPEAKPEPEPGLATALLELARTNAAMVAELSALRQERTETADRVEALERAVQQLAAQLAGRAGEGSAAPHVRRG